MITDTKTRLIEPDITVFAISGRLGLGDTLHSIESAIRKLIDEGSRRMVIDVAGLNYIDSAGIGMLMTCNGHIEQNGGRLRIAGAHGLVEKSFQVVRLQMVIPLDPDVESACRHIAADAASA